MRRLCLAGLAAGAGVCATTARPAMAQFVAAAIAIAPPPLPIYLQPPLPAPGLLWTPGYWAWGDGGYFWVPGVWVAPPRVGLLWTPGFWALAGGLYAWHAGYWGPHVGYYGGINYGFGYGGFGFAGGGWRGGGFAYNTAFANVGATQVNTYVNRTVVNNTTIINHASFNGPGGVAAQPTPAQAAFAAESHVPPTANQFAQARFASEDRSQLASFNGGRPGTAASANIASYSRTAQTDARVEPITAAERAQGRAYEPNAREANQDQRIANGLKTGQITSGEAARADATQSAIDSQVRDERTANGGTLTGAERQQVQGEQNAASRQIFDERHNGNTIAPNAVDEREANQQQRLANGLRSGEETSGEAGRANAREAGLDAGVHAQRVANGGALTPGERRVAFRQENRNSRQVFRQQHNAAMRRPPPMREGRR